MRRAATVTPALLLGLALTNPATAQGPTEQKLTASDASSQDRFGWSVALSGNTAIVGADSDDDAGTFSGSAYVFVRSGTSWTEPPVPLKVTWTSGREYSPIAGKIQDGPPTFWEWNVHQDGSHSTTAMMTFRHSGKQVATSLVRTPTRPVPLRRIRQDSKAQATALSGLSKH